jgi:predicted anti-sigma-YlaC factor YlaD
MQQEKLVLPKFTVPGQRDWLKWVLVGVGGLVAVNLIAFAVVLSKRTGAHASAVTSAKADDVPLAPSATPTPVAQPKAALAVATAPVDTATPKDDVPAKAKAPSHRSHHGHGKALAKAGSGARRSGKPDALDELLKRFK